MTEAMKEILINSGYDSDDFEYVDRTCDNIKFRQKETQKILDVRW